MAAVNPYAEALPDQLGVLEALATALPTADVVVERRAQSKLYYREILRGRDPIILARIPEQNIDYVDLMSAESRARELGDLRASRKLDLEIGSIELGSRYASAAIP